MTQDLKALITWPEAQGAGRVADAVAQLEQHLANLQAQKGTSHTPLAPQAEVTRLREQNRTLQQRQHRALGKLDTLLEALRQVPDAPEAAAETPDGAPPSAGPQSAEKAA